MNQLQSSKCELNLKESFDLKKKWKKLVHSKNFSQFGPAIRPAIAD